MHKYHLSMIIIGNKSISLHYKTGKKASKFRNANNYIVMAGKKAEDLDERIGYFGEHLVLQAQTLGLIGYEY